MLCKFVENYHPVSQSNLSSSPACLAAVSSLPSFRGGGGHARAFLREGKKVREGKERQGRERAAGKRERVRVRLRTEEGITSK